MANQLSTQFVSVFTILFLGFGCKTAEIKDRRKLDQGRDPNASLALIHQELVEKAFDSAIANKPEILREFMADKDVRAKIAKDFYDHRLEYEEIIAGYYREGFISEDTARQLEQKFDTLARLGDEKPGSWTDSLFKTGADVSGAYERKMRKTADSIYEVIGPKLRTEGLNGFLKNVFSTVMPEDDRGKKMFEMMFNYFDQQIAVKGINYQANKSHQLDVVKKAAKSMLQTKKGDITLWDALLIEDQNGLKKLNMDEIAGKGLVRLMEQSGPVMTKIIQTFLEDMPPEMQEAVRSVQGALPPMDRELTKKRFQEIDIDLSKQGVYTWPTKDEVRKHLGESKKTIFEVEQGKVLDDGKVQVFKDKPLMFYRDLGTASLSDSKILYLKRGDTIEEVVVKFIKEDAIARYNEEVKFFNQTPLDREFRNYLNLYIDAVPGEFDLNAESDNLKKILEQGYYSQKGVQVEGLDKSLDFSVVEKPRGIDFSDHTKKAIIMTKASGRPISSWVSERESAVNKAKQAFVDEYKKDADYEKLRKEKLDILRKKQDVLVPEERKKLDADLEKKEAELTKKAKEIEAGDPKTFDPLKRKLNARMDALEELDKVVQGINRQWIISAYETGIIHPDPHQGNVFLDFPEDSGSIDAANPQDGETPKKSRNPQVMFIDVGGTVKVQPEIRDDFVRLLTAFEEKSFPKAMQALRGLCMYKCRHVEGSLDSRDGKISKIVGSNDTPDKKLLNLLEIVNDTAITFDNGFNDFIKGQAIMMKNAESVHKKTMAAFDSHHLLIEKKQGLIANKKLLDPGASSKRVFEVDLRGRFVKTYVADGAHAFASKYLRSRNLSLPAIITAAAFGTFIGPEIVYGLAEDDSTGESHSCVIEDADVSLCITYDGLDDSAYKNLQADCVDDKKGSWLANDYACGSNRGNFFSCNFELKSVSYASNQAPQSKEHRYICKQLKNLIK